MTTDGTGAPQTGDGIAEDATAAGRQDTGRRDAACSRIRSLGHPLPGPRTRGRHRRPRPRKVLLTAGGLALAAAALSLVRLAPEYAGGGPDTAQAEPRPGAHSARDLPAGSSAAGPGAGAAVPSATAPLGGAGTRPVPGTASGPATSPSAAGAVPPSALPDTSLTRTAAEIALRLIETMANDETMPELRVGMAFGTVTTRMGDVFGTTGGAGAGAAAAAPAPPAPPSGNGGVCLPIIGLCVGLG